MKREKNPIMDRASVRLPRCSGESGPEPVRNAGAAAEFRLRATVAVIRLKPSTEPVGWGR